MKRRIKILGYEIDQKGEKSKNQNLDENHDLGEFYGRRWDYNIHRDSEKTSYYFNSKKTVKKSQKNSFIFKSNFNSRDNFSVDQGVPALFSGLKASKTFFQSQQKTQILLSSLNIGENLQDHLVTKETPRGQKTGEKGGRRPEEMLTYESTSKFRGIGGRLGNHRIETFGGEEGPWGRDGGQEVSKELLDDDILAQKKKFVRCFYKIWGQISSSKEVKIEGR